MVTLSDFSIIVINRSVSVLQERRFGDGSLNICTPEEEVL